MNTGMRVALLSASVALASQAMAADRQEAEPRQYLSPMASYLIVDEDRDLSRKGLGASLAYGRQLSEHWWWESELAAYGMDSRPSGAQDFYQYAGTTGLMYAFGDRKSFTPYVVGAVGVIYDDVLPNDDDSFNLHANVGLGAVTGPLFDNGLKLRAEGRYMYDDFDGTRFNASEDEGGFKDWRISIGLEVPLGYTTTKVVEKVVYKTKEVEKVVEVAPKDSDGDGIPDSRDECPNTIEGGEVDGKGCLLTNQTITFNNIGFELDSAKLTPSTRPVLDRVAKGLKSQGNFDLEVAGHTDSTGSAAYNETLSDERANAVRQYLIEQGVEADRLTARGYGEMDPIASNDEVSGRAMNRRVEFRVTEQ